MGKPDNEGWNWVVEHKTILASVAGGVVFFIFAAAVAPTSVPLLFGLLMIVGLVSGVKWLYGRGRVWWKARSNGFSGSRPAAVKPSRHHSRPTTPHPLTHDERVAWNDLVKSLIADQETPDDLEAAQPDDDGGLAAA